MVETNKYDLLKKAVIIGSLPATRKELKSYLDSAGCPMPYRQVSKILESLKKDNICFYNKFTSRWEHNDGRYHGLPTSYGVNNFLYMLEKLVKERCKITNPFLILIDGLRLRNCNSAFLFICPHNFNLLVKGIDADGTEYLVPFIPYLPLLRTQWTVYENTNV